MNFLSQYFFITLLRDIALFLCLSAIESSLSPVRFLAYQGAKASPAPCALSSGLRRLQHNPRTRISSRLQARKMRAPSVVSQQSHLAAAEDLLWEPLKQPSHWVWMELLHDRRFCTQAQISCLAPRHQEHLLLGQKHEVAVMCHLDAGRLVAYEEPPSTCCLESRHMLMRHKELHGSFRTRGRAAADSVTCSLLSQLEWVSQLLTSAPNLQERLLALQRTGACLPLSRSQNEELDHLLPPARECHRKLEMRGVAVLPPTGLLIQ